MTEFGLAVVAGCYQRVAQGFCLTLSWRIGSLAEQLTPALDFGPSVRGRVALRAGERMRAAKCYRRAVTTQRTAWPIPPKGT